jgi:hypothetical protein
VALGLSWGAGLFSCMLQKYAFCNLFFFATIEMCGLVVLLLDIQKEKTEKHGDTPGQTALQADHCVVNVYQLVEKKTLQFFA